MRQLLTIFSLGLIAAAVSAEQIVAEFSGSRNATTTEFSVQAPWILDWRVTGNYTNAMGFEITLLDGRTRMHKGRVLKTYSTGNGVELFNESGTFRFRISAGFAKWSLKVAELSREEAERYTPRSGP